jgi:hypothetical protein
MRITRERIDELLAFLPVFEAPGFEPFQGTGGGEELPDGSMTFAYPLYAEEVSAFYRAAGQACWCDTGYQPRAAHALLQDDARLGACGLDDIRSLLTYCVRGERFCDGHLGHLIRTGRVAALLRRLAELRSTLRSGTGPARA